MSHSFSPTAGMQNGFDITRLNELNPREREIVSRRESLLGPSYKLMYEHPVEFVRGEGVFLYDDQNNAYLDCYNNVPSVGHCNPAVVEAVSNQVATLNTHTRYMSENILNYSEQLLNTFEPELGHVMYTCTGSEAVDLSLRIAKFYTGGTGIIVTDYAYHGITTTVAAISTTMGKYVPVDQHVRTVRAPDAYRAGDDVDVEQRLADDIEAAIADMERHGIKFAGFIADSIFSTDGLLTTPLGFLKKAIDVVHKHGGVYIADEVQPGFARTGSSMWGYQRHGIIPDLVVMGKPMGNGLPIAAVVAKPELLDDFGRKVRYFNTFAGNPVCIAAAQAVLNEIQNKDLMENSRILGDYLLNGFRMIAENYSQIGDVRGAGLYHAIEFVKDTDTKVPDGVLTRKVVSELRERRILISTTGKGENSLKIRPLLTFSQDNADLLLNQFEDTLKSVIG
ncbi:TPA: aspartate aminotransferase family protein [Klebsiella pneumoniae]